MAGEATNAYGLNVAETDRGGVESGWSWDSLGPALGPASCVTGISTHPL